MRTVSVSSIEFVPSAQQGQTPTSVITTVTGTAKSQLPRWWVVIVAVAGFALATWIAWTVFSGIDNPTLFKVGSDYTALAALIVAAAAIERLLEPFAQRLLSKENEEETAATEKNEAAKFAADPEKPASEVLEKTKTAAKKQALVDRKSSERAIAFWAIASTVALVAPVGLGLFFLGAIASKGSEPNQYIDMVATALAIGAGTKPLHDTIDRIQKKKQSADGAGGGNSAAAGG